MIKKSKHLDLRTVLKEVYMKEMNLNQTQLSENADVLFKKQTKSQ